MVRTAFWSLQVNECLKRARSASSAWSFASSRCISRSCCVLGSEVRKKAKLKILEPSPLGISYKMGFIRRIFSA